MPMIEMGLLATLIGCIIGIATFTIGRLTAAKNTGQEWGEFKSELKTDIAYIKRDVGDIKTSVGENSRATMDAIRKEENERKDSIRRVHERLEEHLKEYHNTSKT